MSERLRKEIKAIRKFWANRTWARGKKAVSDIHTLIRALAAVHDYATERENDIKKLHIEIGELKAKIAQYEKAGRR